MGLGAVALLAGCRGPSADEIIGSGLQGALLFAIVDVFLLAGAIRVWERLRHRAWQPRPSWAGLPLTLGIHLMLSALALAFAESLQGRDAGLLVVIWGCAAATQLSWGVIIWRVSRIPPAWAILWAAVPALALGIPGGLGNDDLAGYQVIHWFWGGLLGAIPAGLILLVWIEALVRREPLPEVD